MKPTTENFNYLKSKMNEKNWKYTSRCMMKQVIDKDNDIIMESYNSNVLDDKLYKYFKEVDNMTECEKFRDIRTPLHGVTLSRDNYSYHVDSDGDIHRYCKQIIINNDKEHNFQGEKAYQCEICRKVIV